ncbi:ABC transporter permease [Streptomyces sp. NPDC005808]|uniref:ABC transporter permease n=1 Tax=Streptomyces sp. NPDC005808 TaxID=3364734 RepID=UPI0036BE854B
MQATATHLSPAAPPLRRQSARVILRNRSAQLVVALLVISALVGSVHPGFLSRGNIEFIMLNSVVLGLISLGQTFVIISRGIDLSVAPIMGLTAVVTGLMSTRNGLGLGAAVLLALVIGLVLGAVNGFLVSVVRIPPIIVTLGTLGLFGGFQFLYTNGDQVTSVPASYDAFGNNTLVPGLPRPVLLLAVLTVVCWAVLRYTVFGRNVFAVGNNEPAARAVGIPVRFTVFSTYLVSGLLAGLAGLVYIAHTAAATATTGTAENMQLQSIAAVLIGGTMISGGRGGVLGGVLGSLFLSLVLTALVFSGVPAIWNTAGQGVLILIAVLLDARLSRPVGGVEGSTS